MKPFAAIVIALFSVAALPSVASARPHRNHHVRYEPPDNKHGAIALSPQTRRIGWSYGYGDLGEAQNEAVRQCGESDCFVIAWEQNQCAALVEGDRAWTGAGAPTQAEAEAKALTECSAQGSVNCHLVRWVCS
ncbi:MAG: DUF4189 domain-containing protein [Deltaproteobacteria bacterium]|nr:MAG: DUF4189 domain-containing protein [Deltaproteobacteria bacterium]